MRRLAFLAVALLAELLSWPWLALGFVIGVCVAALIAGYQRGRWEMLPVPPRPFEEDEDD
jgi:hypothetical protein